MPSTCTPSRTSPAAAFPATFLACFPMVIGQSSGADPGPYRGSSGASRKRATSPTPRCCARSTWESACARWSRAPTRPPLSTCSRAAGRRRSRSASSRAAPGCPSPRWSSLEYADRRSRLGHRIESASHPGRVRLAQHPRRSRGGHLQHPRREGAAARGGGGCSGGAAAPPEVPQPRRIRPGAGADPAEASGGPALPGGLHAADRPCPAEGVPQPDPQHPSELAAGISGAPRRAPGARRRSARRRMHGARRRLGHRYRSDPHPGGGAGARLGYRRDPRRAHPAPGAPLLSAGHRALGGGPGPDRGAARPYRGRLDAGRAHALLAGADRLMPSPIVRPVAKRIYDVAVLGPDVGGAATAALCSRRGLRALLAPLMPVAAARESEGWLLPCAQSILPPLRQLSGAVGVLDEAGLGTDLQRQGGGLGSFQILTDRLRLSLPADPAKRKSELRRELSDGGAAEAEAALETLETLGRAWDEFLREPPPWPPRGFLEKRRLRKVVPPAPQLPEGLVGECLHALAPFITSLPGEVAPESLAREAAALLLGHTLGPLLLTTLPARRARGESTGERLLTVARVSDAGFSDEQGLLTSIRGALEPIFPFFERHVVHQSADANPAQPHSILRPLVNGDPVGLRPFSEADEHVVFASAATYPGFGLEGQILAARAAAGRALALSGRKTVNAT